MHSMHLLSYCCSASALAAGYHLGLPVSQCQAHAPRLRCGQAKPLSHIAPACRNATSCPPGATASLVATGRVSCGTGAHEASLYRRPCLSHTPMSVQCSLSTSITPSIKLQRTLSSQLVPFPRSTGAHEAGHRVAAANHGVKLSPPFLLPSALGLLGSFGAITRFRSTVPNR